MKMLMITGLQFFMVMHLFAQVEETATSTTEQQLENSTANNEDLETEDDSYLQQLEHFLKNPVNLNEADINGLKELQILSPVQVHHFIIYRKLVGNLVDVYELQAVPGWDLKTIRKLRPYVRVGLPADVINTLYSRLKRGEHSILIRASQTIERSKGYRPDSSGATNFYPGSPQRVLLRYKYRYKNMLQYGIVAEKDAGEQFFKGKQKQGFDFYSFHLFTRNTGIIQSLAIGDFTVNMGQGLTQWQSLAFKKSADVINIKRESAVLRPYHSAGEINFHRGMAVTLGKKTWQVTAFASYRKLDANLVVDTLQSQNNYITSLQTSGYHRTKREADDRGTQRQLAFGGSISFRNKRLYLGLNGMCYQFKLPLIKSADPYNRYAWRGKRFGNYSFDYSVTFRNIHFFGEVAVSSSFDKAFVNGLIASVSPAVDLSLFYRHISSSYQSLYTSAFTESTYPSNEKGFYAGISLRPSMDFRIDAYVDFYKFPWLKYRVDAPSNGSDYFIQLTYHPNKQLDLYTRYHAELKANNINSGNLQLPQVWQQPGKNWRTQIRYRISRDITIRNRTEISWFDKKGINAEQGFLVFFDFLYKPALKPFSGNLRLQYFETDGYNSRLYAFENDVPYSYSIPVFYDKGYRYYINISYDRGDKYSIWLRWAQTIYRGKTLIGSGLDEIPASHKSDIRIQALYKF